MGTLTVTILTENTAGGKFGAEHGLSYLLEIDNEKILFDTGFSDLFLKNAALLGIDIKKIVETVVLSHGHWDHGDGLRFIENKKLITHPASFLSRYHKSDRSVVGLAMSKDEIEKKFELTESAGPYKITENLLFLGEIPRNNSFESKATAFELENGDEDFIPDDSALVAVNGTGIVVVTGCSHSGICNICEYAKEVTGFERIAAVIGGFHLKKQDEQTRRTIDYFKRNKIKKLLPSHCTQLPALAAFYDEFNIEQVKTGMIFRF